MNNNEISIIIRVSSLKINQQIYKIYKMKMWYYKHKMIIFRQEILIDIMIMRIKIQRTQRNMFMFKGRNRSGWRRRGLIRKRRGLAKEIMGWNILEGMGRVGIKAIEVSRKGEMIMWIGIGIRDRRKIKCKRIKRKLVFRHQMQERLELINP